jgi:hypothetical protein
MVDISKLLFDLSRRGHGYLVREVWRSQGEPVCSQTKTSTITVSDYRLTVFRRRCNYETWITDTRSWISVEGTATQKNYHRHLDLRSNDTQAGIEFLALLLNHHSTVFCMSSSNVNVQPLRDSFNGLKTWKSHGDMQGVWHFPQHAIQSLLNSVGHRWTGTVV